jgi:hypothetical protein
MTLMAGLGIVAIRGNASANRYKALDLRIIPRNPNRSTTVPGKSSGSVWTIEYAAG